MGCFGNWLSEMVSASKQWLLQTWKKFPDHYGLVFPHLHIKNYIILPSRNIIEIISKTYVFSISAFSCTNWTHNRLFCCWNNSWLLTSNLYSYMWFFCFWYRCQEFSLFLNLYFLLLISLSTTFWGLPVLIGIQL